jgi:hypothetical protein
MNPTLRNAHLIEDISEGPPIHEFQGYRDGPLPIKRPVKGDQAVCMHVCVCVCVCVCMCVNVCVYVCVYVCV